MKEQHTTYRFNNRTSLKRNKIKQFALYNILAFSCVWANNDALWAPPIKRIELIGDIQSSLFTDPVGRFRITHSDDRPPVEISRPLDSLETLEYEARLIPDLHPDLSTRAVQKCGHTLPHMRCKFNFDGQDHVWEGLNEFHPYPLLGSWSYQEDPENHQTIASLVLRTVLDDGESREITHSIQPQYIPYQDIGLLQQEPPRYQYDGGGKKVFLVQEQLQGTQTTRGQGGHPMRATNLSPEIPGHEGHKVVFVLPTAHDGSAPIPSHGRYTFVRSLLESEFHELTKETSLLYTDGENLYFPHITQELWSQNNDYARFLIASYRSDQRLNKKPLLAAGHPWKEGLYKLDAVEEREAQQGLPAKRIERWQYIPRHGEAPQNIEQVLRSVPGVSAIPGMAGWVIKADPELPEDMKKLRDSLNLTIDKLRANPFIRYKDQRLIAMGRAGSGKSAFLTFLMTQLYASKDKLNGVIRFRLDTGPAGQGPFPIGHKAIGTEECTAADLPGKRIVLWDTPGSHGIEEPLMDIKNRVGIKYLLTRQSPFVVSLIVNQEDIADPRFEKFNRELGQLADLFPDNEHLMKALLLVVTHEDGSLDISDRLKYIAEEKTVSDSAKALLNFLNPQGVNPTRIFTLPKPQAVGIYPLDIQRQEIITAVQQTAQPMTLELPVHIKFKQESVEFIHELAKKLNDQVTTYLSTVGLQKIMNLCTKKIKDHMGSVSLLRQGLRKMADIFKKSGEETEEQFADKFEELVGAPDRVGLSFIRRNINYLKFLQNNLIRTVKCEKDTWVTRINLFMDKLRTFAGDPQINKEIAGSLLLKDGLIGMSDVNQALKDRPVSKIDLFATTALLIDEGLELRGGQCYFHAPLWKISAENDIVFNLSGLPGAAESQAAQGATGSTGNHGKLGNPGGKGGIFIGDGHQFKDFLRYESDADGHVVEKPRLTINTSGGAGGDGQQGGKGGSGASGNNETYPARGATQPTMGANQHFDIGGHRIAKIIIRAGCLVDAIELFGRAGESEIFSMGKAGRDGGIAHEINFGHDEYLTGTMGSRHNNDGIHQLGFFTNRTPGDRPYGLYGSTVAYGFNANFSPQEVTHIYGDVGDRGCLFVHNVRLGSFAPIIARTDGKPGGDGGNGGKGGIGGHAGQATIDGLKFIDISDPGTCGKEGLGGKAGEGGRHGSFHACASPGKAADGNPGKKGENPTEPDAPPVQKSSEELQRIKSQKRADSHESFMKSARNPDTALFVGAMPHFE